MTGPAEAEKLWPQCRRVRPRTRGAASSHGAPTLQPANRPSAPADAARPVASRWGSHLARLAPAPPRDVVLYVLTGTVLLLVVFASLKLHKVLRLADGLPVADALPLLASDVAWAAVWAVGWVALLSLGRHWLVRAAMGATMHLAIIALLLFAVVEHGFFLSTGWFLQWDNLEYAWSHAGMINEVVASEMSFWTFVAFGGMALLGLLPLAVARWRPFRAETWAGPRPWRAPWPRRFAIAVVGSLAGTALVSLLSVADDLYPLRRNAAAAVAAGAAHDDAQARALSVEPLEPRVVRATEQTKKHNVVLIVLESLRAQSVTSYAPDLDTTPFFAKLAERGLLVESTYTVLPHTTKALVSIHCGIYPRLSPYHEEAAKGALPVDCLASMMADQGYATAFFQTPDARFEKRKELVEGFGFEDLVAKLELEGLESSKRYDKVGYFGYEDKALIAPSLAWIDAQRGKGPFFAAYLTVVSHHPYDPPKRWPRKRYADDPTLNLYQNAVRYTDSFLEELFAEFERRGMMDDTVFVLVGDHGEGFGEHGRTVHDQVIYEEGLRVPLLVVGPGVAPGRTSPDRLHQIIDVVPTVLDALDLELTSGTMRGRSVLSGAPSDPAQGHERIFNSCWSKRACMSLREGPLKFIYHYDTRKPEVFDIRQDPQERDDLFAAGDIPEADVLAAIEAMKTWRDETNARHESQAERRKRRFVTRWRPLVIPHETDIVFDDFARLIGYEIEQDTVSPGGVAHVTYYYEVLKPPGEGWRVFVHREARDGWKRYKDHVPVGGSHPIADWRPGEFIVDRSQIHFDIGEPSRVFDVWFGFYNPERPGNPRAVPRGEGLPIGPWKRVKLPPITLVNPDKPPRPERGRLSLPTRAQRFVANPGEAPPGGVVFEDLVRLVGCDAGAAEGPRDPAREIVLTCRFEALQDLPRGLRLFVHLQGPDGKWQNADHVPVQGKYPFEAWAKGDLVTDVHKFKLRKPGGTTYRVVMGLWRPGKGGGRLALRPVGEGSELPRIEPDRAAHVLDLTFR